MTESVRKRRLPVIPRSRFAAVYESIFVRTNDLREASNVAGLPIRDDVDLERVAFHLSLKLGHYCLFERGNASATTEAENQLWLKAVARWSQDGVELLGLQDGQQISAEALRILCDTPQTFGAREPIMAMLSTLPLLVSVAAGRSPSGRTRNLERLRLLADLRVSFLDLHGSTVRFGVSTRNDAERYGPALEWCRSLFAAAHANAREASKEMGELLAWSRRSNALADAIRQLGERTTQKPELESP